MKRILLLLILCIYSANIFASKRALVIGISEYRDTRWMKPRVSAERDIFYVKEMLQKTGFGNTDITILRNQQATKAAIVRAMKDLATISKPGDIVYIHFSGHGQLMTDVDGDEEPNILGEQWDEAWIPYDASYKPDAYDQGDLHLCDDEVGLLLSSIQKKVGTRGEVLVVIDACHSGDATREQEDTDMFYESIGDADSYANPLPVTRGTSSKFVIEPKTTREAKAKKMAEEWITISACKAYQVNSEMHDAQGLRIGMLTYGLYSMLSNLSKMSNRDFEEYLTQWMAKNKHPQSVIGQNPQVTGAKKNHNISKTFKLQQR